MKGREGDSSAGHLSPYIARGGLGRVCRVFAVKRGRKRGSAAVGMIRLGV